MLFKNDAQTVFIDTATEPLQTEATLDIILSPAFYWVRRQKLPVRFLREAKKLAPSIFDDILPEGQYSYTAYKDGDAYLLFAYSDKEILQTLATKGIKPAQIKKVYFAQSEFDTLEVPLSIDDESVLGVHEGMVVKLPAALCEAGDSFDLATHKCSSHTVDLSRYAHIADRKSMIRFGSFMAVLTVLFAAELGIVTQKTETLQSQRDDLFAKYDLKRTMVQNEAILKRLNARYEEQTKLRKALFTMMQVRLGKKEYISKVEHKDNAIKVVYTVRSKARAGAVSAELKLGGLEHEAKMTDTELSAEVRL